MAEFHYQGRNAQGAKVSGVLSAANAQAVAQTLQSQRITPLAIEEQASSGAGGDDVLQQIRQRFKRRKVALEELIIFCRQMRSLNKAGVPIIRAMRGLAESGRNEFFAEVLQEVATDMESGMSLAAALRQHPKVFMPLFISMINVGENTGKLDVAFGELSGYLELERETRKRIKQATRYPTFVMLAMGVALTVINLFVIPAFAKVFEQFRAELPLPTRILIGMSDFMVNYWWLLLLILVGSLVAFFRYIKTDDGALWWDKTKLRLPIVGGVFERIALGRFSRTFAMMYQSGVPILQTLSVNAGSVGNLYIGNAIIEMRAGVERGEALTRTAANTGLFTPLVLQMMAVGEETGSLDSLFLEVADFYEQEVDYDLKRLADAIEPILIVALGIMVLVLALGVFLPMWELSSAAKGKM